MRFDVERRPALSELGPRPIGSLDQPGRYVCVSVAGSGKPPTLICPTRKEGDSGSLVAGLSRRLEDGQIRPAGEVPVDAVVSKDELRLEISLKDLRIQPGPIRWYAFSRWSGFPCEIGGCVSRAPNEDSASERIYPLINVGCTRPPRNVYTDGPSAGRKVALTFDDGPSAYTNDVLDVLDRFNADATFFMLGQSAAAYPDLARRVLADGHEVANHSYRHALNPSLSDISATSRTLKSVTGFRPCIYRPPYGSLPSSTASSVPSLGMASILWDVDTNDWQLPGASTITARASQAGPGSIVLMHDGGGAREGTVASLAGTIRNLRSRGLKLVTVTELLGGHFTIREDHGSRGRDRNIFGPPAPPPPGQSSPEEQWYPPLFNAPG